MQRNNHNMTIEKWFLLIISAVVLYLFWLIMEPFAFVLVTATITAIVLSPAEHHLNNFLKHKRISSAIISLGVVALVLVPIILLLIVMAGQARDLLTHPFADQGWIDGVRNLLKSFLSFLPTQTQEYILTFDLMQVYGSITTWTFKNIGIFFASTTELILNTVLYFLALYYLLVYREVLKKNVVELSPLRDSLDENLLGQLVSTIRSVVFGVLLLAVLQGILAGIGMTIFGVPGGLIWGAVTIIAALVPFVGTALVLVPAVLYLFFTGAHGAALGLLIWSVIAVGLADNFIGPFLIKGTTNMNAFLILLSILGGLQTFGPIGIIVGPTILAGFMALIELYKSGLFVSSEKVREKPRKKNPN